MGQWLFVDGRGVLFEVAPRDQRARQALPVGAAPSEAALKAALAAADRAVPSPSDMQTERQERAYWLAYWGAFLHALGLPGEQAAVMQRKAHWARHARLYPEVPEVLAQARQAGHRLGVISNGWPSTASGLAEMGLSSLFDIVITSSEVGCRKPDPRIFRAALSLAGVEAHEAWFVDDQPQHVREAMRLGMRALLLDRTGVRGDVRSLAELPGLMRKGE